MSPAWLFSLQLAPKWCLLSRHLLAELRVQRPLWPSTHPQTEDLWNGPWEGIGITS